MNLVLLGLRASGKTELGRRTAALAHGPFVDLDDLTPRQLGESTLAEAWNRHGQTEFRKAEAAALREVLGTDGQIIALGGGTPTAPGCAALLRAHAADRRALLVYLHAPPSVLRQRMAAANNVHRPSLTGADPLAEIEAVYASRDPLYRDLAQTVMDTEGQSLDHLSALLADLIARG